MIRHIRAGGLYLLALVALLAVGQQHAAAQQPQPQQVPQAEDVDRETLETFAMAYLEINEIGQRTQMQIQTVQDPEELERLQREAETEMEGVLEEHEMTREEYLGVAQVLNADAEKRQEFEEILRELLEEEPDEPR